MNDSNWKEEAVRQSSDWLDTDEEGPLRDEQESTVDPQGLAHLADLHLIDALLANLSDRSSNQKEQRIRAVMAAINETVQAEPRRGPRKRWYSLAALAAGLLITCIGLWLQFSRESAAEELLIKISQVSLENTDRVYDLRRITSTSGARQQRDGKLYLRGVEGFVVECGDVVLGRNKEEFWFVASDQSVVVADDFEWLLAGPTNHRHEVALLKELSIESRHVPLMEFRSVVKLLQHDYDVKLRSGVQFGQRRLDELVGTRRRGTSDLPVTILLWSDQDSQIIHRAEFSWQQGEEDSLENSLVLELADPEAVPADWYRHDAHRSGNQPVHRMPSGS